jgi:CMP-N-acetylneuraminic acid synthetase
MKVVALIPFWSNYNPLPSLINCIPLQNIGGKSLISRTVEIINQVKIIDEVIIFASNSQFSSYMSEASKYSFLKRHISLDSDEASIEDIIESFLSKNDADIVVLIHPKSPFLKPKTIKECVSKVSSSKYDSAFTANSLRKPIWFKDKPVNFSQSFDTPNLLNLEPVIIETSSVYVFTRNLFNMNRRRIGENPFIKKIGHFESFEVEREDDFKMAELFINAGLNSEGN